MRQIEIRKKQFAFLAGLAALVLTSSACLSQNTPTRSVSETWTQVQLHEARRLRNDPRLYGIKLDAEQYARYLEATGQAVAGGK